LTNAVSHIIPYVLHHYITPLYYTTLLTLKENKMNNPEEYSTEAVLDTVLAACTVWAREEFNANDSSVSYSERFRENVKSLIKEIEDRLL
jgi:hypothetical protein